MPEKSIRCRYGKGDRIMWTSKCWNFIKGYVMIRVKGSSVENFLNLCIAHGIPLADLCRRDVNEVECRIPRKNFEEVKTYAAKCRCHVKVLKKRDKETYIEGLKRGKFVLAGMAFFFIMVLYTTGSVWIIELKGLNKVKPEEVVEIVEELGLKPGARIKEIDRDHIQNQLILKMDDLIWAGLKIDGTRAVLEVVEREEKPGFDVTVPCVVVAKKDGVIENIVVLRGEAAVKAGDKVQKGDVLIDGYLRTLFYQKVAAFVHADGLVQARRWYDIKETIQKEEYVTIRTGKEKRVLCFSRKGKEFPCKIGEIPFEKYEEEKEYLHFLKMGDKLPFQVYWTTYHEIRRVKKEDYLEEAIEEAVRKNIPKEAKITQIKTVKKEEKDHRIDLELKVEVIEPIGVKTKMTEEYKNRYINDIMEKENKRKQTEEKIN